MSSIYSTSKRWWSLGEVRPNVRKLEHCGALLKGVLRLAPLPSVHPGCHGEQSFSVMCSHHDVLCCHWAKATEPDHGGLKTLWGCPQTSPLVSGCLGCLVTVAESQVTKNLQTTRENQRTTERISLREMVVLVAFFRL